MKKELIQRLLEFQAAGQKGSEGSNGESNEGTKDASKEGTNEGTNGETNKGSNEGFNEGTFEGSNEAAFDSAKGEAVEGSGDLGAESPIDAGSASEDSEASSWEVESALLPGFSGLQRVKDVDEYGRETERVVSQRCEVSVLTTFTSEAQQSKAKLLSLDGLLEYTRKDTREKIFEVSLLGEVFKDMLLVRFGRAIGELLRQAQSAMRMAEAAVREAHEAKADAQPAGEASKEVSKEASKDASDEVSKEASKDTAKEAPKETPSEEKSADAAKELAKELQAAKKSVAIAVSREMFIACRYFDTKNRGELSQEQLQHILLNSGAVCCKSEGEKLVNYVLDRDSLRYRKLYKNWRVFSNKRLKGSYYDMVFEPLILCELIKTFS